MYNRIQNFTKNRIHSHVCSNNPFHRQSKRLSNLALQNDVFFVFVYYTNNSIQNLNGRSEYGTKPTSTCSINFISASKHWIHSYCDRHWKTNVSTIVLNVESKMIWFDNVVRFRQIFLFPTTTSICNSLSWRWHAFGPAVCRNPFSRNWRLRAICL